MTAVNRLPNLSYDLVSPTSGMIRAALRGVQENDRQGTFDKIPAYGWLHGPSRLSERVANKFPYSIPIGMADAGFRP
jgi:hypothetical protein